MSSRKKQIKVLFILGTRPEVIKLAPVIQCAQSVWEVNILSSQQHIDLIADFHGFHFIRPAIELTRLDMKRDLTELLAETVKGIAEFCKRDRPDLVVVQGDTTTALAGALAGFQLQIPVAHVEAGLRTADRNDPFPEEMNRRLISQLSTYHFCPTFRNKMNLMEEGIEKNVYVVGNTIYDAITLVEEKLPEVSLPEGMEGKKIILVTCHRRENLGPRLDRIVAAIKTLLEKHDDIAVIAPLHPNPAVRESFKPLESNERAFLLEPFVYPTMLAWIKASYLLLTDSGGLVEEAPFFSVPTLILRETTERGEAVECGVAKLVGTQTDHIVEEASQLLIHQNAHQSMAQGYLPFAGRRKDSSKWSGTFASEDIVSILTKQLA